MAKIDFYDGKEIFNRKYFHHSISKEEKKEIKNGIKADYDHCCYPCLCRYHLRGDSKHPLFEAVRHTDNYSPHQIACLHRNRYHGNLFPDYRELYPERIRISRQGDFPIRNERRSCTAIYSIA